jgi:hypothetical protein
LKFLLCADTLCGVLSVSPPQPSTRPRWLLPAIIGGVVVIAAAVVLFVVKPFGGDGSSDKPSAETPHFAFRLLGAQAVPGMTHAKPEVLRAASQKAGGEIRTVLNRMFALAFLDPHNWKKGNYDNVVGFFDLGAAQQRAAADVGTLTLGKDAGDRFSDVQPAQGVLRVRVLLDPQGHPTFATAIVVFKASATGKDGSTELVVSQGQYFMHILEGGWTISAYDVTRGDHPVKPSSGKTSTPTGTAT